MRCDYCNVEIVCKTEICPLCRGKVSGGEILDEAFPTSPRRKGLREIPFTKLYAVISMALIVLAAILNIIFARGSYYWLIAAGGLAYLYYCIRITALSYRHFNMKIFGQTAALTALGIVLQSALGINLYICEIVLPLVYVIAIIVVFVNILVNINNARSFLVSFMFIALLGVVPVAATTVKKIIFWPSIAVAAVSAITLVLLLIIARKRLADEFSRILHR